MTAYVSGSRFGSKAATRVGTFLLLTLGFPLLVYGLLLATNPRWVGGAAGMFATIAGAYFKPFFVVGLVISMIRPCWQRMGSLGLPPYWGLLVPLLFLMDAATLMAFGTSWGSPLAIGILRMPLPYFALLAILLVIAMSLANPPSPDEAAGLARFGKAGKVVAALGITLLPFVVLHVTVNCLFYGVLLFGPVLGGKSVVFGALLSPLAVLSAIVSSRLQPLICVLFACAVIWIVVLSREDASARTHT